MAPSTHEQRESVFGLTGDELAEYIARHRELYGVPPLAGGAPDEDADGGEDEDTDDDDAETADSEDGDEQDDDQEDDDAESDAARWKAKSRKNEREKKAALKELEQLKKGKQTDQQKALDAAREEAKAEARAEAQKELRSTRLEASVTRLATDFADPEDALDQIERAIKKGDVDEDDIFDDDGKVNAKAVEKALAAVLKRKPHLAGKPGKRFQGPSDARKGGPKKTLEDKSPEDHLKDITRAK